MDFALEHAEPCGSCRGCRFRAELAETLAWVDRKMMPDYEQALRELQIAKTHGEHRSVLDELSRTARRRRVEYLLARERFLTPEACRWAMCERLPFVMVVNNRSGL